MHDAKTKFRKFQNPSELEPRLERMLRVLRDLEQGMCYIELASDDGEAIEGQLNNCIVSQRLIHPLVSIIVTANVNDQMQKYVEMELDRSISFSFILIIAQTMNLMKWCHTFIPCEHVDVQHWSTSVPALLRES